MVMNEKKNPALSAFLFDDELYLSAEDAPKLPGEAEEKAQRPAEILAEKPAVPVERPARKPLLIVTSELPGKEENELLEGILKTITFGPEDREIVPLEAYKPETAEGRKFILFFLGDSQGQKYKPFKRYDADLLIADCLADLLKNRDLKRKLWTEMKALLPMK